MSISFFSMGVSFNPERDPMGIISIRIPEPLEYRLDQEALNSGKSRSEVVREAITAYVDRKEHERILSALASSARALAGDTQSRREAKHLDDLLSEDGLGPLQAAEAGDESREGPWWR